MKIQIDTHLTALELYGTSEDSPQEAKITDMEHVAAKDLPFDSNKDKYKTAIEFDEKKFDWYPNKSSLRNLVKVFGDDSQNWIGQTIKLYTVKQQIQGELRDVIYASV